MTHNGLNRALSQLANVAGTWDRCWISAMTNGPVTRDGRIN